MSIKQIIRGPSLWIDKSGSRIEKDESLKFNTCNMLCGVSPYMKCYLQILNYKPGISEILSDYRISKRIFVKKY